VSLIREDGQAEDCELVAPGGPGGSFDPIQKTLWLDPAAAPTTPNGSIAAPFTTLAATLAAIQADATTGWQVMLPPATVAFGTQETPLVGVQTLVLQGVDRTLSSIGNFAPCELDDPPPRYMYRDLNVGTLHYRDNASTWPRQLFENVDITTSLTLDVGPSWTEFVFDNCNVQSVSAGSVTAALSFRNCLVGGVVSAGLCAFHSCTIAAGTTHEYDTDARFFDCTFGAGVNIITPIRADSASEISLLGNGGTCVEITSLDGDGAATPLPDGTTPPDITFATVITRAYLEATTLTGNSTQKFDISGGVALQTFTIDNYNTTGFTKTIQDPSAVSLAVLGTARRRYVFQIDSTGSGISLISVTNVDA